MTEPEWRRSNDPAPMLRTIQVLMPPDERLRRFGATCVRRVARLLPDEDSRQAFAVCQRWQDLPVLADALEDAGCRAEVLLAHLRSGETHLPDCRALRDALAGG